VNAFEIGPFLRWFEGVRRRTRALAEAVPADLVEKATVPGRFTPGDILRHIAATERWMWGENARLRPSRYPGHGPELAEGKTAVLAYLDEMHAQTVEILEGLGPEDLERRCSTVGGVDLPVWKWLRLMVEHEIHHRGQLYETLGVLGIQTPPLYGLTEPQVRERSRPTAPGADGEARSHHEDR
jgi:uncharacterized damage-inducible protein DinB